MKSVFKPLLIAGLLAGFGFSALAQSGPMGGGMGGPGGEHRGMMGHHGMQGGGKMDPAKMEERMAARQASKCSAPASRCPHNTLLRSVSHSCAGLGHLSLRISPSLYLLTLSEGVVSLLVVGAPHCPSLLVACSCSSRC